MYLQQMYITASKTTCIQIDSVTYTVTDTTKTQIQNATCTCLCRSLPVPKHGRWWSSEIIRSPRATTRACTVAILLLLFYLRISLVIAVNKNTCKCVMGKDGEVAIRKGVNCCVLAIREGVNLMVCVHSCPALIGALTFLSYVKAKRTTLVEFGALNGILLILDAWL